MTKAEVDLVQEVLRRYVPACELELHHLVATIIVAMLEAERNKPQQHPHPYL